MSPRAPGSSIALFVLEYKAHSKYTDFVRAGTNTPCPAWGAWKTVLDEEAYRIKGLWWKSDAMYITAAGGLAVGGASTYYLLSDDGNNSDESK